MALKPIYEPAAYEKIRPLTPEEIANGETPVPEELIGTLAPNYDYDDPIFKELGVTSMNTPRPKNGDPAQAAWDTQYQGILAQLNEKIAAHNEEAQKYNAPIEEAAGQKIDLLTVIETYAQTSEEQVTSSMPGNIRAGGSIELHGDTVNKDSNIIAGGTLHTTGALTQEAKKQQAQTVALGTTQFSYTRRPPWPRKGRQRRYKSPVFMTPEVARSQASPIGVGLYEGGIARENLTDEQRRRIHNALSPFGLAPDGFAKGSGAEGPEHLLVSALYRVHPESTAKYLIETDPAFTDRRKFLSSDYMYQRLRWDPDKVPKRIGDGFYEQQLLAEQILRQTGKRHLDGYTDDEAAFQALMDAGISYAAEMNIAPGVALTKEQIEALTSDMIWLEEREVYVRGKKERAVYPVLYMKNTNGLRLTAGGSLISAKNISVETTKALKNAGTLYAENIRAHAGDIENEGMILAKDVTLTSDTNIKTTGTIQGESSVLLDAKESIYAQSTTEKLPHQDVLDQTANISVKNDEGTLLMRAGRNIELTGASLSAQGKNGSIQLTAGNDIVLGTNRLQSEKDMTLDASNYLRTKRGTEFVTEIQADGNVSLAAGNDLSARAAAVASKNADVSLTAGNDVKITSGEESSEDHYAMRYKERGLFSSKTTAIRTDSEERSALSANISGKNIHISAAKDAELQAANVIADGSANVSAGRNLTLSSAENYARLDHYKEVKKSGIFGSGGLGFTIGTQRTKTDHDREATTQQGTNIAALGGNVSLTAGETAHLTSANVLAGKEASVTAKETTIDGRENVYRESYTKEVKTSGLTVSFGHGLIDLGQKFYAPLKRIGEVEDDRLKAAYAWRTGRLIHDYFGKNALALHRSYTPSLNLSLGTSRSYNRSENVTREYAGSMIRAGELANLTAAERDLTIKGSTVESKDVSLTAKGNVRLEAGENTSVTTTADKYSSASVGASFGINGLSDISVNVNRAKGNSKETYTSYSPALIRAEENAVITSGKDTDILGSKVQGDKVTARVGGNLNIETLQEKETYEEQNTSTGFGISWNVNLFDGKTKQLATPDSENVYRKFSMPNIGGSFSKGTINSHYKSARDQAGIFAGTGGFDLLVGKNTDLKGALIASKAPADKNKLSTGTLSFSDLENEADYSAKSIGAAYHKYGNYDNMTEDEKNKVYNTKGLAPNISMPVKGNASSRTTSAIAEGTIDIRENPTQDISALSRDTENALNELGRIFDKDDIKEKQELMGVLSSEGYRLIGDYSLRRYQDAIKEAAKHKKGSEEYKKAMKEAARWEDGGTYKTVLHASFGGFLSSFSGANFATGAVAGTVNELMLKEMRNIKSPELKQIFSLIAGGAVGKMTGNAPLTGAAVAEQATQHNFLTHEYQVRMAYALKEALDSGNRDHIINVLAYFAALSSYSMNHPTNEEQLDWILLDGPIEQILLEQLQRIDNPNDSINASDMINDVLNRIVTSTYGIEATILTNNYYSRIANRYYKYDEFTIPDKAFEEQRREKNEQQIKTHLERIARLAETNPKEYVQYAYQNGGYWNNSGILVVDGIEHPDFLQRGDYEYQYNNAEIIGYAADGTPMAEAASTDTNGNTVMKSYPVWSLPKGAYSEIVMGAGHSNTGTEPPTTGRQTESNTSQPLNNNLVPPMKNLPNSIDIVVWIPIRDNLPHVAIRENYDGKRKNNQELHFGNYTTKNPTAIGPGTVLYVTSDGPVQAALEKGEAYTLGTITDPTAIADIIGRQNAVLQSFPKESRSVLRPAVIEEHGGEDIHVYHAIGDYAEYSLFRRNCLSFAKYIIGGYSEELNNFSNTSFYDSRLWRDK